MTAKVDRTTLEDRVREAMIDCGAEPSAITRDATLEELGIDSLDLVEISEIVDDEFGIMIDEEKFKGVMTVGDAIDRLLAAAAEA